MEKANISDPKSHSFASVLQRALKAKGWSNKRLAEFLEKDASTVSLWIAGRHKPRADEEKTITKLAEVFGQDPTDIRNLIMAPPDRSLPDGDEQLGRMTILTTPEDCEHILVDLLDTVLPKHISHSISGVQERLNEHGYVVREDLLRIFLQDYFTDEDFYWDKDQQAFIPHINEESPPIHITFTWQYAGVRQACYALNAAFTETDNEILPKSEVLQIVDTALTTGLCTQQTLDASGIVDNLIHLKLLSLKAQDRVERRWSLNPEFFINHIWGIWPHIPGLGFLLDGGLLPPVAGGLPILVTGQPGTGKTSFALQMTTSIAVNGCAVYLSAEENLWRLVERLSFAGYNYLQVPSDTSPGFVTREGQQFALVMCDTIDPVHTSTLVKEQRAHGRGTLIFVALPNRNFSDPRKNPLLRKLDLFLTECSRLNIPNCYAIDSLDAMLQMSGRRIYEKMFAVPNRSIGFFLSEERYETQQMDERLIRDHMVDMVIRLSQQISDSPGRPLQRFIEIRKSRSQHHRQGKHLFSIHPGRGMTVYPSIQARLSVWMNRVRRTIEPEPVDWTITNKDVIKTLNFNSVLQNDVVRGSSILLTGPASTHKLPISLTFLASQLDIDENAQVILISLRDDEASLLNIIETYPQLSSLLGDQPHTLNPRLRVLYRPPAYFTAARFLDWIRVSIRDMQPAGEVRRALFHNLNRLRHSSPLFAEEPLFVSALVELFRKERITTLFVQVKGEDPQSSEAFDTILLTDHGPGPDDPDTIQFSVGHTTRCDAYRDLRWVRRIRTPKLQDKAGVGQGRTGEGWLELLDTLE